MSTKIVYAMLAIVAVVGGFAAIAGMTSEAYAFHGSTLQNQGKCIQLSNAVKQTQPETAEQFKREVCQHK